MVWTLETANWKYSENGAKAMLSAQKNLPNMVKVCYTEMNANQKI